jgi:hypothetical protein
MADTTILAKYIVLQDTVQGNVNSNLPQPVGGFTGSEHHNVATAKYDVGTKVQVYDETSKGYSTFVYLKNGTAAATIAAGQVMIPAGATQNPTYLTYVYTNDPDDGIVGGNCAIALSAMTDDYYGWFWCGGVAPVGITNSGITSTTTIATDDSVAIGAVSTGDLTADKAGLILATTLKIDVGIAMKADG